MKFIADLHIHSKYSRATSKDMDVESLDKWGRIKGIKVLGTGDFTHPAWIKELKEKLEPAEQGLFKVRNSDTGTRFVLSGEISCIYSKNNRVRKIHIVVLTPDFLTAEKINTQLSWIGNIKSDGRPILGLDAKELAKIVLSASPDCLVIPAHIWTPWFSLFGANSGFDTIEECFEDYSPYIYAVETGLSSDPKMNWRLSALDNITLISNSDAHSAIKIGREANVLDTDLTYNGIAEAFKNKNSGKFIETIEFFPQEGRYHYDGHRKCNVYLMPVESKEIKNICPVCGRPLTVGTCHRVEDLADRAGEIIPQNAVPFKSLIPLNEIIAEAKGMGVAAKTVKDEYDNLVNHFDSEFDILLKENVGDVEQVSCREVAEGISRVRSGNVNIEPGYDGEYGKIKIFKQGEQDDLSRQNSLF